MAKTRVWEVCLTRNFLFADDAAVTTHTEEELQQLMQHFTVACEDFGLTISLKKTQVMGQDVDAPPSNSIRDEYALEAIHKFIYWRLIAQSTAQGHLRAFQ